MKAECVAASVLLTIVFVAAAHADCKKGEVLRTNTRGQPQCIKQGRTFNECVQDPNLRASNTNCSSIVRASSPWQIGVHSLVSYWPVADFGDERGNDRFQGRSGPGPNGSVKSPFDRFCCRTVLRSRANSDSVEVKWPSTESFDDGAVQG
jgi:hypothetical protein